MLTELNLPYLQIRRNKAKLQMLYKVIHKSVAISDDCLIPIPTYIST